MPILDTLAKASLALAVVLFLVHSPASAQSAPAPSAAAPNPRMLNIVGSAEVHAAPDAALVMTGVLTEGDTAAAALKANSATLAKVVEVIRSSGVEAKDLQTSGLSLAPRYQLDKLSSGDRQRIIGYAAVNEISVRVRDLAKVGDLLDKATAAGANRLDGIEFVISNQEGLLDDARQKAVAD